MNLGKFQYQRNCNPFTMFPSLLFAISAFIFCSSFVCVESGNILVLVPMGSKSHKNVFQPFAEALAERGHNLTIVSPFMPSKPKKNIREIVPTNFAAAMATFGNPITKRSESKLALLTNSLKIVVDGCHQVYSNPEFMNLLNEKFDLIYLDAFMNDCMAGFIYKTGSPFILVSPAAAPSSVTGHAGNRLPPSFVPHTLAPFSDEMNFLQRLANLGFNAMFELVTQILFEPKLEAIYRQYLGQDLPSISQIYTNVSLILMNSHFTINYPRPTLPDVVEVGGMQCGPAKPLPKDLADFLNGAKDGVIFFSLGSIIQGNQMPENMRKIFVNVFSRLKERVLWKWETEEMPDLPKNVRLGKWLPQQDILGHKNVKLFITHGGLLSTQEATYHGVPLIGIPIMGDQDLNAKQAEQAGYSLTVEILEITEESLEKTIQEILTNPKYTIRAKKLSQLYRDQTETPVERAVFWSEYIMRHKGAQHLRSAARKLNFFQYHSLDVIAVLFFLLVATLWIAKVIIVKILKTILSIFGIGKKTNASRSKKNN